MMNSAMAMAASLARGSKHSQEIPSPATTEQKLPLKVPTSDKEQSSNVLQRLKTKLLGDVSVKDDSCAETSPRGRDNTIKNGLDYGKMMARHSIERGGSAPSGLVHPYGVGVPRTTMHYAPPVARPRLAPPGPSPSDRWDIQHGVSAGAHGRMGDARSRQAAAKPNRPAGSEIKIQSLEEWKDCLSEQKTA